MIPSGKSSCSRGMLRSAVSALILLTSSQAATASEVILTTGDSILLRAGLWDQSSLEYRDWSGVSGEYSVDPAGRIQVPLAGNVEAAGESLETLAEALSQQIQRRVGLTTLPEIAVEIASRTPVYVTGAVQNSGEFPFRQGMNVLQLLSLAGGLGSGDIDEDSSAERNAINHAGSLQVLSRQIVALEREATRLREEIAALETQTNGIPFETQGTLEGLEKEIFEARQRSTQTRAQNIADLQEVISEQIIRLDDQIALRESQLTLAREEAEAMEQLTERGLAVRAREAATLSNAANVEAQLIQLEVARLEAIQQLNLARRDEITLYDEARLGRLGRLNEVELELSIARAEHTTAQKLYLDAVSRSEVPSDEDSTIETRFFITRMSDASFVRKEVQLTTELRPGDSLEVNTYLLLEANNSEPAAR